MPFEMFPDYLWEDWYEALNNGVMNDGVGLMISYYLVNSFEFLLLGFLLLIGSLVLVNLNKLNKDIQHPLYNSAIEVFQFIQTWVSGFFIRKQNLTDQEMAYASTRSFGKK